MNSPEELAKANAEMAKRIQEMTLRNLELQRLHLEEEIERLRAQNRRLAERDYKPGLKLPAQPPPKISAAQTIANNAASVSIDGAEAVSDGQQAL